MDRSRTDIALLFTTRIVRMFAYGFLSVILALYLAEIGMSGKTIGLLFTLTLVGDAVITLWITTSADRIGRRRMLAVGAALMVMAGVVFIFTKNPAVLMLAAIIGVISPSGYEIGPFLSIEQASLSQLLPGHRRTHVFAWYNLVGSFSTACGALVSGWLAHTLQGSGYSVASSYRVVLLCYALSGVFLASAFAFVSSSVEIHATTSSIRTTFGLHRSRNVVFKLASLFAIDAFAGGFVVQSLIAYWFHLKFGIDVELLGRIFFGANILAGVSALLAARIAARIGLIRTMVFTHIPSNILLCLVPFMPTLPLAILVLLIRFSISQMDVPTRQSYTMAVVAPDERSAAAGVTAIARSVGAAISPALSGILIAMPVLVGGIPFVVAGGLKIVYDLLVYHNFQAIRPPEERAEGQK